MQAIGVFADLWLYGDRDWSVPLPGRDFREGALDEPCPTCGAKAGDLCSRPTAMRRLALRRMPHTERGGPSLRAHYRPSQRGQYQRRGAQ